MLNQKMEQVRLIKASCTTGSNHLPFKEIFNAAFISSVFENANLEYRDRVACGLPACSTNTSNYVRSRQRLPAPIAQELCKKTGNEVAGIVNSNWLWKNRNVDLLDGSTLLAPDTEENRAMFPIHGGQNKEVGYPYLLSDYSWRHE